MTTPHKIDTAAHTALMDVLSGVGLLALPRTPEVHLGPGEGLHEADWHDMLKRLDSLGWEPLADEDDLPMDEGRLPDGRRVVALFGRQPVHDDIAVIDLQRSRDDLWSILTGLSA